MARLTNVEIKEVSAVDRPANKRKLLVIKAEGDTKEVTKKIVEEGGKFCLYDDDGKKLGTYDTRAEAMAAQKAAKKREIVEAFVKVLKVDGEPMSFNETYLLERLDEISNDMFDMCYALRGSIMSILTQGGGADMIDESVAQFARTMSATIKSWLAGEATDKGEKTMLTKEQIAKIADPAIRKAAEQHLEEHEKLKGELEAAKTKEAELQKKADDADPEAIWKGTSPALREMFQKQQKELDEQKRLLKRGTFIAKAAKLDKIPQSGTQEEWADLLEKVADGLPKETVDKLDAIFTSVNELIKSGSPLAPVGSNHEVSTNLVEKIEAEGHAIAKSEGATDYNVTDYYSKVFKKHPDWYAEYSAAS